MKLDSILLVLLGLIFFGYGICFGQVSVIHFNSEWNEKNNSVPTIIIFDEQRESIRFEANIMMELVVTKKELQSEIDNIYLKKFE